jgi:hypothetical protein
MMVIQMIVLFLFFGDT